MPDTFLASELKDFLGSTDRELNDFFTGRDDLRTGIIRKSGLISKKYQDRASSAPAEGSTIVIQGPPGIGKTSLLEKIRQDCLAKLNRNESGQRTIPVMIKDPGELSFQYLAQRIRDSIDDLSPGIYNEKARQRIFGILSSLSSVSAFGFGVGFNQTSESKEDDLDPGDYTILLLIDEIQSVPRGPDTDAAKVLMRLHTGSNGYPILPVLAGHANSATVLAECGLYRLGHKAIRNLPPLTSEEVKTSFGKFINKFNIATNPEKTAAWEKGIVTWVDGWPKHLHNALAALGEELLEADGDLRRVKPALAKRKAMDYRLQYYEAGFKTFAAKPGIVGEVMAGVGTGADKDEIVDRIDRIRSRHGVDQMDVPGFEELLRKGFIYPQGSPDMTLYHCPIPSLQSYAVAKTGSGLHASSYAGNENNVRYGLERGFEVNGRDAWGRTPLHIAVTINWPDIIDILLEAGGDPTIRDKKGKTPLDIATPDTALVSQLQNPLEKIEP